MTIEFDGQNNKLGTTTANSVTIKTNDTDAITVDSSQNVGIGTSSPNAPFDVIAGTDQRFLVRELGTGAVVLDAVNAANSAYQTLITNGSEHILRTNATEAMRINSSGNVIIPNGVTLGTAVGTYNAANTLDDYEEGTWTPEYEPFSGDPFTSITYGFRNASYTKIGRKVTCLFSMRTSALTKGTASGAIIISGLPFTVGNDSALRTYNPVGVSTNWLVNEPSNIRPTSNTSYATIQKNFANESINVSDMDTGGVDNFIGLEFTYFID